MRSILCCCIALSFAAAASGDEPPSASVPRCEIAVNFKLMEISHTNLKRMGFDFCAASQSRGTKFESIAPDGQLGAQFAHIAVADADNPFLLFLPALEQIKEPPVVRALAASRLVAPSGSRGHFRVDDELAIPAPHMQMTTCIAKPGTCVDFQATLDDNGAIRLDLRYKHAALSAVQAGPANGINYSAIHEREFVVSRDMKPGQTLIVRYPWRQRVATVTRTGPRSRRVIVEEVRELETILLARPELPDIAPTRQLAP